MASPTTPPFLSPRLTSTFAASLLSHFPPSGALPPSPPPNPDPLPSFWTSNFSSPLTHAGENDPLPREVDVVVVGAGLTGVCATEKLVELLLADEGSVGRVRIAVLEAREFCSGATARNGGHLTASPLLSYSSLLALYGPSDAQRAAALEQHSIDWVLKACEDGGWAEEVELRVGGGNLHLFEHREHAKFVKTSLDAAKEAGEDLSGFQWLQADEVLKRFGAQSTAGGLLIPGHNVYPLKFVTKLFQRAQARIAAAPASKGVELELFTHCVVHSVEKEGGTGTGRWTVRTARGDVVATHVIHCTNGHLTSVLPSLSLGPARILPTRGQVLSLVPASSFSSSWPRWGNAFSTAEPFDTYMFQRSHGRRREILLGGCRDAAGAAKRWEFGEWDDGGIDARVGAKLREFLGWQFPNMFGEQAVEDEERKDGRTRSGFEIEMEWGGIMGYRANGAPMVGPLYLEGELQEGQWISAGYSGHGMPRAPGCAHLVASLVHRSLSTANPSSPMPSSLPKPFHLPRWFPRYLLTTPSGESSGDTRVPGEGDAAEEEEEEEELEGWVWVERSDVERYKLE
ncbi:hypothetical protein JCM1841_004200 [Sporobolomyces salmonicolor]